jgi:protein-S-isoprenylcysteine O-methyltransferase Ste14
MPVYLFGILAAAWVAWALPFFLIRRRGGPPQTLDRRARWGIGIQAVAYMLVWQPSFWTRAWASWRLPVALAFLTLGPVLSWTSARTLGRQWRFDAGLNADHQLIRSGAYRYVRHPIYTSMFCMLIGTGFLTTGCPSCSSPWRCFSSGSRSAFESRMPCSRPGSATTFAITGAGCRLTCRL